MKEPKYKVGDAVDAYIGDDQFEYGPIQAIIKKASIGNGGPQYEIEVKGYLKEFVDGFIGRNGIYIHKLERCKGQNGKEVKYETKI